MEYGSVDCRPPGAGRRHRPEPGEVGEVLLFVGGRRTLLPFDNFDYWCRPLGCESAHQENDGAREDRERPDLVEELEEIRSEETELADQLENKEYEQSSTCVQ